jgi:adenosylcobinamide kinase/adenosylcobinamide-phosphate guanylyltransferase
VITLVLGGARSGKSEVAERLCHGPVTYVATGVARDDDMAARIADHRARRPAAWVTVEVRPGQLVGAVRSASGTVLVDSLTTWVAECPDFEADGEGLCTALAERRDDSLVVSDELGWGVHPSTEAGRRFRDRLGAINQLVAAVADRVLLVVAGRVLPLEPLDAWAR